METLLSSLLLHLQSVSLGECRVNKPVSGQLKKRDFSSRCCWGIWLIHAVKIYVVRTVF